MKQQVFDFYTALIEREAGIHLSSDKAYLLEGRLSPIARKYNLPDIEALSRKLAMPDGRSIKLEVIDALTTNESFFFRDGKPFDQFRDIVLPEILARNAGSKKFRIWSAACSSGQEAYSLAMLLKEQAGRLAGWQYEIVGTDLSREMVARAKTGIFSQFEVQRGLPVQLLVKYFKRDGLNWALDPAVCRMVSFREHNLLSDSRLLGKFDAVFCRNVLIYFEPPTKRLVLTQIARATAPNGALFLGSAETALGVSEDFAPMKGVRGLYALGNGAPKPAAATVPTARPAIPNPTAPKTPVPRLH